MHRPTSLPITLAAVLSSFALLAACGGPSGAGNGAPVAPPTGQSDARPQSGGKATLPSEVIDLTNWYLTLPTGKNDDPDDVYQPDLARYTGDWFRVNETGDGVVFTANAGGVTTKGSNYPRSELREMKGSEKASWSNRSGTHTMQVRQAVTQLPLVKQDVVAAQIHDAEDDVVEVRLEGERLLAEYDDGDGSIVLDEAYRIGTPYDLQIKASGGRIEVTYNGKAAQPIPLSGTGWYFKAGSYVQSNPSRGEDPAATGQVVIYELAVTHTG
ncbi:polysaccharide lyase family 7 protein [Actinomycetes bacterium KLBMP 9759]